MSGTSASGRVVGVTIPEGQNTERSNLPDLTIVNLAPLEFFAAQYVENGKLRMGMYIKAGNVTYLDPDGERWVNRLRQLSDKLAKNFGVKYAQMHGVQPGDVPLEDSVDVVAKELT